MNYKGLLLEDGRRRDIIRTIVRDIIKVYKEEDDGEFYLPNYIDDEKDFYEFDKFGDDITVELVLQPSEGIDSFKVGGDFYKDDDIIEITVEYNPNNKIEITYDLIGELNEVIAHEIRHVDQRDKGTYDLSGPEEKDPYKYYTQPHEIDAQVFGFKRLSKMTKTPFDVVVKRWFNTHKDVHRLDDKQIIDVMSKILNQA